MKDTNLQRGQAIGFTCAISFYGTTVMNAGPHYNSIFQFRCDYKQNVEKPT